MNNGFYLRVLPYLYKPYWALDLEHVCADYHLGNSSPKAN